MRMHILLAASIALVVSASTAQANSAGGAILPNTDIRALEPPIDVTDEQLRAQGTPVPPAEPIDHRPTARSRRSAPAKVR